jgi:Acetyltransferase (GNAT) domain
MINPYPQLCQQLETNVHHSIVWQQSFAPEYTIALRPVSIATQDDLQHISSWLQQGYQTEQPVDQLRVMYIIIAECNNSQSFMVLLNNEPIGQLDIYQVSQDVLKECYPSRDGDYRLHIPVLPNMAAHALLPVQVVQCCLGYFFSFPEVQRVVWSLYMGDDTFQSIARKTGFLLLHEYMDYDDGVERKMGMWGRER